MKGFNGEDRCIAKEEWQEHRTNVFEILERIGRMEELVLAQEKYLPHLEKLGSIADNTLQTREYLLGVATGKEQLPIKIAMKIINVLLIVIMGLVFVIGTLLIGEHFGVIRELFR